MFCYDSSNVIILYITNLKSQVIYHDVEFTF